MLRMLKRVPLRELAIEAVDIERQERGGEEEEGEVEEGGEGRGAELKGVSLVGCGFSENFFRAVLDFCPTLAYFELVSDAADGSREDARGSSPAGASTGDVVALLADQCCATLENLCLHNQGVRDSDVRTIGGRFSRLRRLALGDSPLRVTGVGLESLKREGSVALESLHLLNGGGEGGSSGTGEEGSEALPDRPVGDGHLAALSGGNSRGLRELSLLGFSEVTPAGVGRHLPELRDLSVRNCVAFGDPAAVCRLCRVNEGLVVRNLPGTVVVDGGFDGAFFDCEREEGGEEGEEEEKEREGEGEGEEEKGRDEGDGTAEEEKEAP